MSSQRTRFQAALGFSLVELLITLAIMGVLAAFTIPPLIQTPASSQSGKYTALAKNTALMVAAAYDQYKAANPTVASTVTMVELTPYLNYLKVDTSSTVDDHPGYTTFSCAAAVAGCLKLHNGATLWYMDTEVFGGTATTNAIWFNLDPDGSKSAPGSALSVFVYYDGAIRNKGNGRPNTYSNGGLKTIGSQYDPSWFTGF